MISGLSMYGPQMTFKVLHTHHFSKGKKEGGKKRAPLKVNNG